MYLNTLYMTILFLCSCLMFSFYYKHILLTLISLEFMMINLLMIMMNMINLMNMNNFFLNFFLSISICEGVLGLSVMVYMIHLSGNDYSNILNLMKW